MHRLLTASMLPDALEQYRREWDDEKKAFKASDVHDWTAHPAAAFRYLALAWRLAERAATPELVREGFTIPPPPDIRTQRGITL
jgi:hypothetical protein